MIIVTGAYGFIGSNLIKELQKRGHRNILAVDYTTREYDLNNVLYTPADYFYENLSDYCKNAEAIFHEGAISSTTETNKKLLFEKNLNPTYELIYYCRNNNIPLQYASSASVYGNPTKEDWDSINKPMNPLNEYAKSKKSIDYLFNLILGSKRPPKLIQGMRYFNVYGPNEDHKGDQASPYHKFKKQFDETGKIKLFEGSENFYRDFISVEELIEKKLYCLENKQSGIYDVGTGSPKSFYDVAVEVGGSDSVIDWIPMPENLKEHYQKYTKANMNWLS
nr:MAG: ADP-L-glycero-D-manno-heptose 6-epimerase [Caudoviricetes sp.]